ncbi:MAG: mandelate racemase/muconate lactonizing enzyme family protein, partial [bacterium]
GLPVYQLLGGKHRNEIKVYSDFHGGNTDNPESFASRATEVVKKGFSAIKMDIDLKKWRDTQDYNTPMRQNELRHLTSLVGAVRDAIGPDVDLAIDCHSGFNTPDAKKLVEALEPFNLLWLEEPIPAKNIDAMAQIKQGTETPICLGENLYTRYEFKDIFQKQATDIIMPDVQKTGGILESKRIADLASIYYVPIAPHCVASPIGQMASVHLCASIANFLILEWHMIDIPWWEELALTEESIVQDGFIKVPEKPGLGIELNEEVVCDYLREGETLW